MPVRPPKRLFLPVYILLLALCHNIRAQQLQDSTLALIPFLQELEKEYNIIFSYVDEDLQALEIQKPQSTDLPGILQDITSQTGLSLNKLSDRYYTLARVDTIDLCALVLDNFEEAVTQGASVEVLETSIVTITDQAGRFSLQNVPANATLRIQHMGFKPYFARVEDLAKELPCARILLSVHYQELEEVVVSQILTSGITKQWDGSININTREFGILPGLLEPDVLQSVQALPGVRSIDETVSDINIRGGTNDQNLLIWDGIKMYQSGHFFGLISAFNPHLTDKITVIKNGTSPHFGDGVSGIIAIETINEVQEQASGGAGLNLISGDVFGHIPLREDLAFQFSARRSVTDFLNTPTYNQFFERAFQDTEVENENSSGSDTGITQDETFYFYDFSGKFLYDLNQDQKLRLSFINIKNNLEYVETQEDSGRSNQSNLDQTNLSFGGNLESRWTDKLSTVFNAYYTRYNLIAQNSTDSGQQQLRQENEVVETSAKINALYQITERLAWDAGYQFAEVGITNFTNVTQPPFNSNIKGVVRTHAPFMEILYQTPQHKFHISGGLRVNAIENPDSFTTLILEPRLNMNLSLGGPFRLEVLGEFKNQTTNQVVDLEQNFLGIEKRRWILSNTDSDSLENANPNERPLPIVRSKQGSVGLVYDRAEWFVGLEGFYKYVDGISTSTQGFQNEDQFDGEIGSYRVSGIELLVNHKNDLFSSWLSYSFNNNEYTFEDITPTNFPNNLDIRHTLTLATTCSIGGLKLGGSLNYRTGKPFTEPEDAPNAIDIGVFPNRINYQDPNSSRLPDYLRADASATYDFPLGRRMNATVGASVLNLLNKRNILNIFYRLNDQDEIEKVESVSLGLTPNLSFRLAF